ncbi:Uncharacterized conserved protein, DUF302 family [Flavobacteriaceae bacterium MAR_2010_188]|nr:Uncharacterized conserved protein, DUF302 family [Flavobacteriaceae bacterium MAR_2010_188]
MKNSIFFSALLALSFSCSTVDNSETEQAFAMKIRANKHTSTDYNVVGTKYAAATIAMQAAYNRLIYSLKKNEAVSIIAEVDHEKNAKSVGLELNPTRVVFFGNPVLGTPLMQKNQLAGLDLPQHVLFFRNEKMEDYAMYNSVEYLKSRYDLEGVATLEKISGALQNLVSDATKSEIKSASGQTVSYADGIIIKESSQDFESTYSNLQNAILSNPNLKIVAELDHQKNAESVGLDLRPTRIIIFGNPNLGTPLMQDEQTVGLDLPQKMLVYQDENGNVFVAYNDLFYLKERHMLDSSDEQLQMISNALNNLSNAAVGM